MHILITVVYVWMVRYICSLDITIATRTDFTLGLHQMRLKSWTLKHISPQTSLSNGKGLSYHRRNWSSWSVRWWHLSAIQRLLFSGLATLQASDKSRARCRLSRQVAWSFMMWSIRLSLKKRALQASTLFANPVHAQKAKKVESLP